MLTVTTDTQHIHTDALITERQILDRATAQVAHACPHGKVLIDLKHESDACPCVLQPPGRGWTVIIYHVDDKKRRR